MSLGVVAAYSHWSQGYLIPSICTLRLLNVVAAYSHWSHGYLISSCFASIVTLRLQDVVAAVAMVTRVSYT